MKFFKILILFFLFFAGGMLFAQETIEPEKMYEIENNDLVESYNLIIQEKYGIMIT